MPNNHAVTELEELTKALITIKAEKRRYNKEVNEQIKEMEEQIARLVL
jgi:epoxyqueuosine reductase QueG